MKLVAKPIKRVINEDNHTEITLLIENLHNQELVKELDKGKDYRIELNIVKEKRTIEQNKLMWKLIHDISIATNGELASTDDDWNIYCNALESAGAKFEYIACLPNAEHLLRETHRAVRYINSFEHHNRTYNQYKVYSGSSKMNTKEMNLLIEHLKMMAEEVGVDTSYYD